jgi:hypothetical protein
VLSKHDTSTLQQFESDLSGTGTGSCTESAFTNTDTVT